MCTIVEPPVVGYPGAAHLSVVLGKLGVQLLKVAFPVRHSCAGEQG